ncbi:MAG: hypothetical protein IVW36_04110 [Dehalococcoidia bacterium]|nr:hypothetical protein [Dehalococcoidia bacterium]
MVKLGPRATSARERFKTLAMVWPRFRLREKIMATWWPQYGDARVTHGVDGAVVVRIIDSGPAAAADAAGLLDERRLERRRATVGEGHQTLSPVAR